MFKIVLRNLILRFSKYGRYADLVAGIVALGLGVWWQSYLLMGLGAFSLFAYAINLNGRIQQGAIAFASAKVAQRQRKG